MFTKFAHQAQRANDNAEKCTRVPNWSRHMHTAFEGKILTHIESPHHGPRLAHAPNEMSKFDLDSRGLALTLH